MKHEDVRKIELTGKPIAIQIYNREGNLIKNILVNKTGDVKIFNPYQHT